MVGQFPMGNAVQKFIYTTVTGACDQMNAVWGWKQQERNPVKRQIRVGGSLHWRRA
jgi:hypothetical protein